MPFLYFLSDINSYTSDTLKPQQIFVFCCIIYLHRLLPVFLWFFILLLTCIICKYNIYSVWLFWRKSKGRNWAEVVQLIALKVVCDRQHCRLSICSYFGWLWQILRWEGLSTTRRKCEDDFSLDSNPNAWKSYPFDWSALCLPKANVQQNQKFSRSKEFVSPAILAPDWAHLAQYCRLWPNDIVWETCRIWMIGAPTQVKLYNAKYQHLDSVTWEN